MRARARWGRARRAAGRRLRCAARGAPEALGRGGCRAGEDPAPGAARADPPGHSTSLPPPPPLPLADASGLQRPPSAPPAAALAPNANPATDERRPPPWLSPPGSAGGGALFLRGRGRAKGFPRTVTLSPLAWSLPHLDSLAWGRSALGALKQTLPVGLPSAAGQPRGLMLSGSLDRYARRVHAVPQPLPWRSALSLCSVSLSVSLARSLGASGAPLGANLLLPADNITILPGRRDL